MAPYSSQPGPSSNFRLARPVIQKSETVTETVRYQRRSEPMTGARAVEKDPYSGPIPRIRTKQLSVSQNNNIDKEPNRQEVVGSKKKGRSKNYDTFDENAIETIYDEFKFLDENDVPSPSSSSARPILSRKNNKTWKPTPSLIAYCLLALIQLVVSVAILVLAALRANNLYREIPTRLLDLESPENFGFSSAFHQKNQALSVEASLGCFVPSVLQGIAALCGFWPLTRSCRSLMQILHIVFSLLAIISWFDEIYYFALDINFSFVQQNIIRQDFIHWFSMLIADFSSTYIVYIIVLTLGYFAVLILPSITLTLATMALCKRRQLIQINLTTVCVSLGSVIVSGIGVAFAAYACTKTLVEYDEKWQKTALSLYGYGLKESLLSLYFMLASVFMFFAFTQRLLGVQLSAFLIQIVCIILLIVYLLTPARFTSIISNAQLLVIYPQTGPISQLNLVVLYSSYVLLLAILCLQLFLSAQSLSASFHLLTQPPHGSFCSPPLVMSNNELSTSPIAPVAANFNYSNSSRSDTIHYAEPRVVISNERTSF